MKKNILVVLTVLLLMVSSALAVETNYTTLNEEQNLHITTLKYDPYPVNPGEYFTLFVSAQAGSAKVEKDVTFQLDPQYPFSLDSNEDPIRHFDEIKYSDSVVMQYKVRVSENAVEGINDLELRYKTAETSSSQEEAWKTQVFKIQVADAQTDFDLVVQESTSSDVSIAIANIGKNTANSLIVRIPDQDGFRATGTNGQMVGNLDAGDYSIVSFGIAPKGVSRDNPLEIQMDYTDNIGERRSVTKEVQFTPSFSTGGLDAGNSGNFPARGRGNFPGNQTTSSSTNIWIWAIVVLVIAGGIYVYFKKFSGRKKGKSNSDKPEWVSSEKKQK